jgi:hypothetical protein
MLSGLRFETAAPTVSVSPDRADIACFIGHVARRPGVPLPADVTDALTVAGWIGGPWLVDAARRDSLEQLPVAFESWDSFAQLFAWEQRPIRDGDTAVCATYLGAALRSFFATGGRRAWVIRVADPFPYIEAAGGRAANRDARLHALIPAIASLGLPALPFDPTDPTTWRGIEHLFGLAEVSHVCLPDLADICAADPLAPPTSFSPPPPPEVFVECSEDEPALPGDDALDRLAAPRSDDAGFVAWGVAAKQISQFLTNRRADALFVGALPLALPDTQHLSGLVTTRADEDLNGFLLGTGVLDPVGSSQTNGAPPASYAEYMWPWLRTNRSDDLPQSLEPADGLFAGLLARNALVRGTFHSVGGTILDDVIGLTPLPAMGLGADSPTEALAARICVIAQEPDGISVESDVTASPDVAFQFGGARRLMGAIRRSARRFGEAHCFEPNGPALWARLRRSFEGMLAAFWREGAFDGANANEAYSVRCDRSTMSQDDLDNGRLIALITVQPAAAISRITVVLDMTVGSSAAAQIREVA